MSEITSFPPIQEIERDSPVPLYFQVAKILRVEIESGKYLPEQIIPTELELQNRFELSRATIRQAISDLIQQGFLERSKTKRTKVTASRIEARLSDLASFTKEIMSSGFNLTTRILRFFHTNASGSIAENLELDPGESVTQMERLRFINKQPIAYERWFAPDKFFPELNSSLFGDSGYEQSTYYVLMKRYGIEICRAIDTISPVALDSNDARLLEVTKGTPGLLRTRTSFGRLNKPVAYASGVYLVRLKFLQESSRSFINFH